MAKRPRLTRRLIDGLATMEKSGEAVYDSEVTCLAIRYWPSGKKSFTLDYGPRGRRRRMKIGSYGEMTVAQARAEALRLKAEVQAGRDPLGEKRAATLERELARLIREHDRLGQAVDDLRVLVKEKLCRPS